MAYNWDERLIDEIVKERYPIKDLYASAQHTSIGGGRPSFILPETTTKLIQDHIKKVHDNGIEFTYTLNAPCMGGQEFLPKIHTQMLDELQWITDIGCDGVIVSIPYLIELIKRQFPKLKIRVSTIAKVNTVNKAKRFEELGATSICPDVMSNRNFKILEKMVKATSCEIIPLVTDGCLYMSAHIVFIITVSAGTLHRRIVPPMHTGIIPSSGVPSINSRTRLKF